MQGYLWIFVHGDPRTWSLTDLENESAVILLHKQINCGLQKFINGVVVMRRKEKDKTITVNYATIVQ